MKAVTWQGARDMQVIDVPDPQIVDGTDAIIKVTSSGLCGSDLHLYEPLGGFMNPGDVVGHEPMGVVQEIGPDVKELKVGDRVVVPFNISCQTCWMCKRGLQSQCETTQNRQHGTGASLLGYSELYGQVPGGQAEYLRVQFADVNPFRVPEGPSDDRFLFLSDVIPTAWQAVTYADCPDGGTLLILGAGPIGDMCTRIALHTGRASKVIVVDRVPDRLARVANLGAQIIDLEALGKQSDLGDAVRQLTDGRGADSVIDAVGMEAHGSPVAGGMVKAVGLLPDALAKPLMKKAGVDKLAAFESAIDCVRRGGTISLSGVYGGAADPVNLMTLFDKQIQLRMGQANVRRWTDDIMPLVLDDADPLGTESFATHHLSLDEAPEAYRKFRDKEDGMIKVVFRP